MTTRPASRTCPTVVSGLSPLVFLVLALWASGCVRRPVTNPNVIVVAVVSAPDNLDPRVAADDVSQKAAQLIYNGLMTFDEQLRAVPDLAERLDNPEPTEYIATLRRGVRFHDGHELTSSDVVYTFRSLLEPGFVSPYKGAFQLLMSVDAVGRYAVRFRLREPFGSFPVSLVLPQIVPDGAGGTLREHPVGTGPYRFVRYAVDDHLDLSAFDGYFRGRPRNDGIVLKIVPDNIMAGLELRKGTTDLVVNDLAPDIAAQLANEPRLQTTRLPGVDYQYIGFNLRDPILRDVRVRQAIGYAIDRQAIITYLRRGMAIPATGILPPMSWAFDPDAFAFAYDPARARALLDEAGYRDPDGDGPATRLRLTLKMSGVEFNRLQGAVVQQNLRAVGIELEIRTYEFATLFADVNAGNFQMYFLQWTGGAVADPDILRRVFHSNQIPPAGYNRGTFIDPRVDRLLDEATTSTDNGRRRLLYHQAQRLIAEQAPYISLWCKTNVVVAQRDLSDIRPLPTADFAFLKDVSRVSVRQP
jgi:peptide/nickel transport system substrate-binding protein